MRITGENRERQRVENLEPRQRALAKEIGVRYCKGLPLKPFRPGDFGFPPASIISTEFIYDKQVWELGWWLVAERLRAANFEIIDHAWLLQADKGPWFELIGFVSEPYLKPEDAATVLRDVLGSSPFHELFATHILPTELSAWNPGGALPVAVLLHPDAEPRDFTLWTLREANATVKVRGELSAVRDVRK
jgi:hypothetical protein